MYLLRSSKEAEEMKAHNANDASSYICLGVESKRQKPIRPAMCPHVFVKELKGGRREKGAKLNYHRSIRKVNSRQSAEKKK